MSIIPLTVFFSLLLAGLFMVLFAHEQRRRRFASAERDSLLPLAGERPTLEVKPGLRGRPARESARHCHCRDGTRPPCPDCLRQVPADDLYF